MKQMDRLPILHLDEMKISERYEYDKIKNVIIGPYSK